VTRVLFLTESFHPVLGGGEAHVRDLARRLAAAGMPATVVTRRGDRAWPARETMDGVRVVRVPPAGPGRTGKYAMVPAALVALWREAPAYDVLVVRGTRVLGLPGLVAARSARKAVVLQDEVNGEMTGEVYTWGSALDRPLPRGAVSAAVAARNRLLRDADAFVAMSRLIRDEIVASGVAPEKVRHIPHGVDMERFRPSAPEERALLRRRLGLPPGARIVTFTGRLLRGKGLETLVEAFAAQETRASQEARAHLLIVGSGAGQALSVEHAIRERVARGDLTGRVTLTGRVDNVEDYLRASDVFAFPSEFEALGLALIEAQACGLACVGSRTGGIVDVIEHDRTGLLVNPGQVTDLAAALHALLADPERRVALGAAARQSAQRMYDIRDSVDRYRALFRELAAVRIAS
jgi:glycosyltransferase involved in cell wall biosynthesis